MYNYNPNYQLYKNQKCPIPYTLSGHIDSIQKKHKTLSNNVLDYNGKVNGS